MYKFRNLEDNDTYTQKTDLQMNWESYLSIALCINCVIFQQLNALFGHKIPSKPRILTVLAIDLVLFLTLMFFAETNTDEWQMEFLIFSLVIAGWIGANEAILIYRVLFMESLENFLQLILELWYKVIFEKS